MRSKSKPLKSIKTTPFSRRAALLSAGVQSTARIAASYSKSVFQNAHQGEKTRALSLKREAEYIACELGKLKGTAAKIGQMMAVYGQHVLPDDVVRALRTLEEDSVALEWPALEAQLIASLGQSVFDQLEIDSKPIGTASLAQVHRARIRETDEEICLKIQYPGLSESLDADFDAVLTLLNMSRIMGLGAKAPEFMAEIKDLLRAELDYTEEANKLLEVKALLAEDARYIVPECFPQFSSSLVLAMSYESGFSLKDSVLSTLSKAQRQAVADAFLDLFFKECFEWGAYQTDPNFGNYRVRLTPEGEVKIVLLDFGAFNHFPEQFNQQLRALMLAAFTEDDEAIKRVSAQMGFVDSDYPDAVLDGFADFCVHIIEPLNHHRAMPANAINEAEEYLWSESDLPKRVAKLAAKNAASPYFNAPPKEFAFLSRKLLGVYGFIAELKVAYDGRALIEKYMQQLSV